VIHIISRQVANSFSDFKEQLRYFGGITTWLGYRVTSIHVQHDRRFAGETTYTWRKLINLAVQTVVAYSDKPRRLAIQLDFSLAVLTLAGGAYVFVRALLGGFSVSGWASVMVSLYSQRRDARLHGGTRPVSVENSCNTFGSTTKRASPFNGPITIRSTASVLAELWLRPTSFWAHRREYHEAGIIARAHGDKACCVLLSDAERNFSRPTWRDAAPPGLRLSRTLDHYTVYVLDSATIDRPK
jgi:hypothetical protein